MPKCHQWSKFIINCWENWIIDENTLQINKKMEWRQIKTLYNISRSYLHIALKFNIYKLYNTKNKKRFKYVNHSNNNNNNKLFWQKLGIHFINEWKNNNIFFDEENSSSQRKKV